MKVASLTLIAALLACTAAHAEQFLNAHYEIDIVDLNAAGAKLREEIRKHGEHL